MSTVVKLTTAHLRRRPGRALLSVAAVIASVCVVVWVVSGYDALVARFEEFSEEYLGRYQLVLVPGEADFSNLTPDGEPAVGEDAVAALREDPAVAAVEPAMGVDVSILTVGPNGEPRKPESGDRTRGPFSFGLPTGPTLLGTAAASPPRSLVAGRWFEPTASEPNGGPNGDGGTVVEGTLSAGSAETLGADVGDELLVTKFRRTTDSAGADAPPAIRVRIVGLVEQIEEPPSVGRWGPSPGQGPPAAALYVPLTVAAAVAGTPIRFDYAGVELTGSAASNPGAADALRERWAGRLAAAEVPAELRHAAGVNEQLNADDSSAGVRSQALAATGISLLAALFIIFNTLSMGVHERIRQFAVLRAIGLTRGQIAGMIFCEAALLGLLGWAGGLAAGYGLVAVLGGAQPDLFRDGVSLGAWSIALSGACAFGGAFAAAALPAWRATRVSPLEAMGRRTASAAPALSWPTLAVGALLLTINPLVVFAAPAADESRYGLYLAAGCTTTGLGFVLLAPLAIVTSERLFGPVVARLARLDPRLLTSQLSENLWRSVGTAVALTLGLGLFAATQVWGYSMLGPFVPGRWTPDFIVAFPTGSLPPEEVAAVRAVPGLDSDRTLPLAVEQARLAEDVTDSAARTSVTRQDNVIVVGLEPERGVGGDDPVLNLTFVQGSREEAVAAMRSGRGCVVPDHFVRETGLGLGDAVAVVPPEAPDQTREYRIVGVVELPGWHWMTKFSGLRRRDGRSAAMVFADYDTVRADFALSGVNYFFADADGSETTEQIGESLRRIGERNHGPPQPVNAQGQWDIGAVNFGETVRICTPEIVRERILLNADGMIWAMCYLPLVTLAVASLGALNAALASVRARRWEMGVLRAVGLTRFALVRLVAAEALLVGLAACLLSLAFGLAAGWCGVGISQSVSFFGGMNPSLVIPWGPLGLGFAATLTLCLLAALWPAIAAGRTEPLRLLREGPSAT